MASEKGETGPVFGDDPEHPLAAERHAVRVGATANGERVEGVAMFPASEGIEHRRLRFSGVLRELRDFVMAGRADAMLTDPGDGKRLYEGDAVAALAARAEAEGGQLVFLVLDGDVLPPTDVPGFRSGAKVTVGADVGRIARSVLGRSEEGADDVG